MTGAREGKLGRLKELPKRIYRSIVRGPIPKQGPDYASVVVNNLILHVQSAKAHRRTLRFRTTLGLGFISFVLFAVLTVTGVMLMFAYVPYPGVAYRSMEDMRSWVTFGTFLRNLHRWAAHAMVAVVFLHMCRVFLTASYKPPRQFNWIVGVILLALTLGLSFTGYLLPWDQLSYWAITVGTTIVSYVPVAGEWIRFLLLGGEQIGAGTLLRFYVLHCIVLPGFAAFLIALHFWRIRKDGGLARPEEAERTAELARAEEGVFPAGSKTYGLMAVVQGRRPVAQAEPEELVFTWPHLIYREVLLALVVLVILCVFSILVQAPLEELADPTETPNPAKAPWYFLGLQELVHYSALLGGVVVPAAFFGYLFLLPYVNDEPVGVGRWFPRARWKAISLFLVIMITLVVLTVIGTFFRGENWGWVWPW